MKSSSLLRFRLGGVLLVVCCLRAAPPEAPRIGAGTQLFADDHAIESMTGLIRRLNPLHKVSREPVLRPDRPWEGPWACPQGVIYDPADGLYKMWYSPGEDKFSVAYAYSHDGLHWVKPSLHLAKFHGSDDNNLLALYTGLAYDPVIIDVRDKNPARRYKMLGYGWKGGKRQGPMGICIYFSADGLNWTENPANPVQFGIGDTHTLMGWDDRISRYVAYTRPDNAAPVPGASKATPGYWTQGIRIISRTTSEDMMRWTPMKTVLEPDEDDPPGTQFYGMSVFSDRGLYFGFVWVYHPNQLMIDVQLALSRDGIRWERAGRRHPVLSYGLPNEFDSHVVIALKPILVGDRYRVYYLAEDNHHGLISIRETYPIIDFELPKSKQTWTFHRHVFVGLADFPRDRLISLDAGQGTGEVVTKPFILEGRILRLNAKAAGGEVRVEITDRQGRSLPGYAAADARPLDGEAADQRVSWAGNSDLSSLRGQTLKLRITARAARLYGYTLEN